MENTYWRIAFGTMSFGIKLTSRLSTLFFRSKVANCNTFLIQVSSQLKDETAGHQTLQVHNGPVVEASDSSDYLGCESVVLIRSVVRAVCIFLHSCSQASYVAQA
jgi:hypothetical protein